MVTMVKLGYLVLGLSQAIGDAEVGGNRREAVELWGKLERAVDQARKLEQPASGTPDTMIDWWESKIYLFTLALHPRAARYATSDWRSMVESELAQAQKDNAKWQASRREETGNR
jgi:hypothetical protein